MTLSNRLICICIAGIAAVTTANTSIKVDLLWKARGLQGIEILELLKQKAQNKNKPLSKKELCSWQLENGYSAFAVPALSQTYIEKAKNGAFTTFKYIFISSVNQSEYSQINFIYEKGSPRPSRITVTRIANNWLLDIPQKTIGFVTLRGDGCIYTFPFKDPLAASADVDNTASAAAPQAGAQQQQGPAQAP